MKKLIVLTLVWLCAWGAAAAQVDDSLVVWKTDFWECEQLELSPDGQYLAAHNRSAVFILDPETGEILQQYTPPNCTNLINISFLNNSNDIAISYSHFSGIQEDDFTKILIYSIIDNNIKNERKFPETYDNMGVPTTYLTDIDVNKQNNIIAGVSLVADKNNINFYDGNSLDSLFSINCPGHVKKVKFSPSGKYLSCFCRETGGQYRARIWNTETWEWWEADGTLGTGRDFYYSENEQYLFISADQYKIVDIVNKTTQDVNIMKPVGNSVNYGNKITLGYEQILIYDFLSEKIIYKYDLICYTIELAQSKDFFFIGGRPLDNLNDDHIYKIKAMWDYVDIEEQPIETFKISVSPNPLTDEITINVVSEISQDVLITVTDLSGRSVLTIFEGMLQVDDNSFNIRTSDLSYGSYFVNVITPTNNNSLKIIVGD